VNPLTPVALRNQWLCSASRAKFGNTRASTSPFELSSDCSGNSSSRISTTGGAASLAGLLVVDGSLSAGRTRAPVGDAATKSKANTSGAGIR
jgi:hypothetical protein